MDRNSRTTPDASTMNRREFLQRTSRTVVGAAAAMALGSEALEAASLPSHLRLLGRTGLKVTTISFGGILIKERRVLDYAIDQGINLIHTAPGYTGGGSIRAFGEVMPEKRDKVILAVKVAPNGIDAALRALNTDYIDIAIPDHGAVAGAPFPNDNLRAAYDAAKRAGKIRFTGFATHGNQANVIAAANATGYFDVMLVAYNVRNRAELDPVLREAKQKNNTGVMVMKAAAGLDRGNPELFAAGLKDLLANRDLDTLTLGMGTYQHVQQNVGLMGKRVTRREKEMLNAYLAATMAGACAMCGTCGGVCPKGVRVADVMRCEHYLERGDTDIAKDTYYSLPSSATVAACNNCGACTLACPKRLNVADRIHQVHAALA